MSSRTPIFQIDAFCNEIFKGNPAAVCPLSMWPGDDTLQAIAAENNLSETAFIVPKDSAYEIRWFTPKVEVALCGHATLATAYVLFNELNHPSNEITFYSQSGPLFVKKMDDLMQMDFPARTLEPISLHHELAQALGGTPIEMIASEDCIVLFETEEDIVNLSPNFTQLLDVPYRGIIATAPGHHDDIDFVSRFFAPRVGINEDPVTGSAHCALVPYWSGRLNQTHFHAKQISSRGGELWCQLKEDRVLLKGQAVKYMEGEIYL